MGLDGSSRLCHKNFQIFNQIEQRILPLLREDLEQLVCLWFCLVKDEEDLLWE